MINVGIDFGSTNTTISVYDAEKGYPEPILFEQSSPYVPSVVCHELKTGKYLIGSAAKNKVGQVGKRNFYKAFKMLIPEKNKNILRQRGYDDDHTPQKVAGIFIENLLKTTLDKRKETRIGKLVIAVPEVWREKRKTVDGIPIIREICQKMDIANEVIIASEPEAASAFFAHNYKKKTSRNYEGNMLLVDYGGGTLDITLTQVSSLGDDKSVQIKSLERKGAGENVEGKIGQAGIVYMETILLEALKREGIIDDYDEILNDPSQNGKFYKAVYALEAEILSQASDIKEVFREYESMGIENSVEDLEEEEFTYIEYKGEELAITYGLLVEVYNKVIRQTLKDKLDEMTQFMKSEKIDYENNDQFKIALVGGFGQYYLVEEQVKKYFGLNLEQNDGMGDIITTSADCEQAISLGTALLANGIITIKDVAPYTFGIVGYKYTPEPVKVPNYAIKYKEEIEYDALNFVKRSDGQPSAIELRDTNIEFVINYNRNERNNESGHLKKEYLDKFNEAVNQVTKNKKRTVHLAFSISQTGILTIHVFHYDKIKKQRGEGASVVLSKHDDMFNNDWVEE